MKRFLAACIVPVVLATFVGCSDSDSDQRAATSPSPTSKPLVATNVTKAGTGIASSEYPDKNFPSRLAIDGDLTTSWFSAGELGPQPTTYTWSALEDLSVSKVVIYGNSRHPRFPRDFGFGSVTVQVKNAAGSVVASQVLQLPGTPDPDVTWDLASPVVGRSIVLVFADSEADDCGGVAEIEVWALR